MSNPSFPPIHGEKPGKIFSDIDENPVNSTFSPNRKSSHLAPGSSTGMAEMEDIEYYTISGKKPYFSLILAKSHVCRPYQVCIPSKIHTELPSAFIPMVLNSRGKNWNTIYHGGGSIKRFVWKKFAIDNDLKVGDCCFFELMECTTRKVEFKVIILRGNLPFGEGAEEGDTPETAIIIE